MAADLYLVVITGDDEQVAEYQRLRRLVSECIFDPTKPDEYESVSTALENLQGQLLTKKSDSIWLGQMSWLTATIPYYDQSNPAPLRQIARLFSDVPVVTPRLAASAHRAMRRVNTTTYRVASPQDIYRWLTEHIGRRAAHESR